uniref:Uncharacterized protein n=1 Tax=Ciona savignyi TaxID=51511 RepID=H2Z6P2_CIOSA
SFKVNNKDGWLSSSVKRYSSLEVAKEAINDHEIEKFCKYILHRRSSYEDSQHHIRWDPADNIPYVISSSYKYECQHGKDRNKFYNKKRQIGNYLSGKKTYKSIKESIKKDCPAFITIREVIKFPLFKPINASLRQRRESSKMLRHALLNEDDIEKILVCYVKFPDDSDHKGHALGEVVCKQWIQL